MYAKAKNRQNDENVISDVFWPYKMTKYNMILGNNLLDYIKYSQNGVFGEITKKK